MTQEMTWERGCVITGLTTGPEWAEDLAEVTKDVFNITGDVQHFQFPYAMAHPEEVGEAMEDAFTVTHSAGVVAAAHATTPKRIQENRLPSGLVLGNPAIEEPITKLIPGALLKTAHDLSKHKGEPAEGRYHQVGTDGIKQSVLHAPSNFGHVPKISKFSTPRYLEKVSSIGVRVVAVAEDDEFFQGYPGMPEGVLVERYQGTHSKFVAENHLILSGIAKSIASRRAH
jgi:hypothetical protein